MRFRLSGYFGERTLQKWWDAGKEKIKGLAVRLSSYKKKASPEARSLFQI